MWALMRCSARLQLAVTDARCSTDTDVEDEEQVAAAFFDLLERDTWSLPHGKDGLDSRWLTQNDAAGSTLIVAFSSTAAHFDFEGSLAKLQRDADSISGLLVSDSELAWFLRVPNPDAGDNDAFEPVISLVRQQIESLRHKPARVLTVGYCRGGYAAIRVGVALRVDKVLAFAPQIYLLPEQRREIGLPAAYYDECLASLKRAGAPLESLAAVLARSDTGGCDAASSMRVRIEIHVGADSSGDVAEAGALMQDEEAATARFGNISVHAHDGCGHEVPLCMRQAGTLAPLLSQWVLP